MDGVVAATPQRCDRKRRSEFAEASAKHARGRPGGGNFSSQLTLAKPRPCECVQIKIGAELGSGCFGMVYKATWRSEIVVVKQPHRQVEKQN